jgi:hypothetical protein
MMAEFHSDVALSWHFDKLLTAASARRLRHFLGLVGNILDNVLLKDELTELVQMTKPEVKLWSHEGLVWKGGVGNDLGNYKYAFTYCALVRVSRKRCVDVNELFLQLERLWPRLAVNSSCNNACLEAKGDIIECVLARSRCTGVNVPLHLHPDRLAMLRSFQLLDSAIDDLYRAAWRGDSRPLSKHMPAVNHFSALVLLAHSMTTSRDPPPEWDSIFASIVRNAFRF